MYLNVVQKIVKVPIDALRKSLNVQENSREKHVEVDEIQQETVRDNYIRESKIMLLSSMLYKKLKDVDEISGLFTSNDELSELYRFLSEKIKENKNYNVSTLFDNFEIKANSLIDKVINYVFPDDKVFDTYLNETIKRVKIYELENKRDEIKSLMLKAQTDEQRYDYMSKLKEITEKINKEKK